MECNNKHNCRDFCLKKSQGTGQAIITAWRFRLPAARLNFPELALQTAPALDSEMKKISQQGGHFKGWIFAFIINVGLNFKCNFSN